MERQSDRRAPRSAWRTEAAAAVLLIALVGALAWLWQKTQSLNPEDHAHRDAALRELRSLDRTINQDVMRARYKLIDSYEPVLESYRRVEELELAIATPPRFLDEQARHRLAAAVHDYRASVTAKQRLIERVKYRTADLQELLRYLPGAGTGLAKAAADSGDHFMAEQVNHLLQLVLLYNLTSDDQYAPVIGMRLGLLSAAAERADSGAIRRRLRTLVTNVRRLLKVKPAVDGLMLSVFHQPIIEHEDEVARVYYAGYATAEREAKGYRVVLYLLCIGLVGLVGYGVRRVQRTARALAASNERLEERVAERTRELGAVLDNVEQALFTVDLTGGVSRERSAALDQWFPGATVGRPLWEVFESIDPNAAGWLAIGWEQLGDGFLPPEVALGQLPSALANVATGRSYRMAYRPIGDPNRPDKFLVVISDVTADVERERREADQQEHLLIFQHVMIDGPDFEESFGEIERLVQLILDRRSGDRDEMLRTLHTIKGNAGMYGFASLATVCHDLESRLVETPQDPSDQEIDQLADVWATLANKVRILLGMTPQDRLEVTRADLVAIRQAIATGKSPAELLRLIGYIERDPVERRLLRLAEQARRLAQRLGKGGVEVKVISSGMRLDSRRWAHFWTSFVHLLRNALDHGLESPQERRLAAKPGAGQITITTREAGGEVVIEVADDGRGIDWESVRAKASARGLPAHTDQDLLAALVGGGLSTRAEATEYSGRGAGLAACDSACRELGGTLTISSARGQGTTLRVSIPSDDALTPRLTTVASAAAGGT